MSHEHKPGDPADKGVDQFVSHRAGYGDDRLERLIAYLRRQPRATLASGEGALLLAEIDRLARILWVMDDMIDRLHAAAKDSADHYADARDEIDRLTRILAALREPSEALFIDGYNAGYDDRKHERDYDPYGRLPDVAEIIHAAVDAAEREVEE